MVQSTILTAARSAGFVITFAVPLVIVRVFEPATFGLYKQVFLIGGTLVPVLSMGLSASLYYFVPRDEEGGDRYILWAVTLITSTALVAAITLVIAAESVSAWFGAPEIKDYLLLLGVFLVLSTPAGVGVIVPVVDRRAVLAGIVLAGSDLFRAASLIAAALLWRTIEAVMWAAIISASVRFGWMICYLSIRGTFAKSGSMGIEIVSQLRYAVPFGAAVLFEIAVGRFHEFFVAKSVSSAAFAIYAVGVLPIPLIGLLVQSIVEVMLVRMAEAYKAENHGEMRRVWRATLERLGVVMIPCWAVIQLVAPDLLLVLFGAHYLSAAGVFRVFSLSVLLLIVVDHGVLRATGDTPYLLTANVVGFVGTVISVIWLVRTLGLVGGAGGFIVGMGLMRGMGLVRVAQRLEIPISRVLPLRTFARIGGAIIPASLAGAAALRLPYPLLRLVGVAVSFGLVYWALVVWWNILPRGEISGLFRRLIPTGQFRQ